MDSLWAPWRLSYVARLESDGVRPKASQCFICAAWGETGRERQNLVLGRSPRALALLNRYPYVNGHLLIAPAAHIATLDEAEDCAAEIWSLLIQAQDALMAEMKPDGFNVGINLGQAAGAGLADHLHVHLVPRWRGDVNFMTVAAETRVISQALDSAWETLNPYFRVEK